MRLAFLLYRYFPGGGRQRDFLHFVEELKQRGHECRVYCLFWEGDIPDGVDVRRVPTAALRAHRRYQRFTSWVQADLVRDAVDAVVGFDAMPGLDFYCAVDVSPLDETPGVLQRRRALLRYKFACERAIFAPDAKPHILLCSALQLDAFERRYSTPAERLHLLPPGVTSDRRTSDDAPARRKVIRASLGLELQQMTLLFVASDFAAKGLDRAITTLANMREAQPSVKSCLLVVGHDKPGRYQRLAKRLSVTDAVKFLGAREDIADLMSGADLLIHPAINEPAGIVLLEALAAGLPVVVTDTCGYAPHIQAARAGILLPAPFSQAQLDRAVMRYIDGIFRAECSSSARLYARLTDLYSRYQRGADLIEDLLNRKRVSRAGSAESK